MQPLEPPDSHHVNAAMGWLELGCCADAQAEMDLISPKHNRHPDVLETRWALLAQEQQWEAALDVATKLLLRAPERPSGWLHRAYAMRRTPEGGLAKAWDALLPAAEKFPDEPTILYNLSCYACQMQQLDTARQWFQKALKVGSRERVRCMALVDDDLQPLWDEIREM
jgi:Tfp pilus assembly protein PilF